MPASRMRRTSAGSSRSRTGHRMRGAAGVLRPRTPSSGKPGTWADEPGVLGRSLHRPSSVAAARQAGAARRPPHARAPRSPPPGRSGNPGAVTVAGELPRQPIVGGRNTIATRRASRRRPATRQDRKFRRAHYPVARTARPARCACATRPRRALARRAAGRPHGQCPPHQRARPRFDSRPSRRLHRLPLPDRRPKPAHRLARPHLRRETGPASATF
jgi:hypothetical protein